MCGSREFGGDRLTREHIGTTRTMITTSRAGPSMRVTGTMKITATTTIGIIMMGITGSPQPEVSCHGGPT